MNKENENEEEEEQVGKKTQLEKNSFDDHNPTNAHTRTNQMVYFVFSFLSFYFYFFKL